MLLYCNTASERISSCVMMISDKSIWGHQHFLKFLLTHNQEIFWEATINFRKYDKKVLCFTSICVVSIELNILTKSTFVGLVLFNRALKPKLKSINFNFINKILTCNFQHGWQFYCVAHQHTCQCRDLYTWGGLTFVTLLLIFTAVLAPHAIKVQYEKVIDWMTDWL